MLCGKLSLMLDYPITPHRLHTWNVNDVLPLNFFISIILRYSIYLYLYINYIMVYITLNGSINLF